MIQQSFSKNTTQFEDVFGGTTDEIVFQHQYCLSIKDDPNTFSEAIISRDDEIDSIMHNNIGIILPPGCKALGCKWILKRKIKVYAIIDKYKAKLGIQGFRHKEGIYLFDTYAHVARISTIRLLLSLATIHNFMIHQMDVKLHS
uniref:Reverse transcriptase Ty1/copia-type domain-containing protein n=1 Tax=Lactuca sativa TaxID=4236 RepID=A0A9R1V4U7_LACSA|nr:hypothetical protein LSAT_V11C700386220 [Lactuca sativa]